MMTEVVDIILRRAEQKLNLAPYYIVAGSVPDREGLLRPQYPSVQY
jgi:hypothetical protein